MSEQPSAPMLPAAPEPIYQNWVRALTRPYERTFIDMAASPNAKASTGYLWYFIGSIVSTLLAATVQGTVMKTYFSQYAGQIDMGNPLYAIVCGAPIAAVISVIFFAIGAAIVQWIAGMFGGRGSNDKLVYVLSNILTPYLMISGVLSLLSAIPYVGFCFGILAAIGGLYILFLEVTAVKAVNQFGWGAAIASLFIPLLAIAFVCACLVAGGFALLYPAIRDTIPQLQNSLPQY